MPTKLHPELSLLMETQQDLFPGQIEDEAAGREVFAGGCAAVRVRRVPREIQVLLEKSTWIRSYSIRFRERFGNRSPHQLLNSFD
jgi:hypothetical protein